MLMIENIRDKDMNQNFAIAAFMTLLLMKNLIKMKCSSLEEYHSILILMGKWTGNGRLFQT